MKKMHTVFPLVAALLTVQAQGAEDVTGLLPFVLVPMPKEVAAARETVEIPKSLQPELRQRMHGFLAHQQKIVYLLGKGEYKAAGILADVGHGAQEVAKFGPIGAQRHWPDAMKKNSQAMRGATKAFVELSENSRDRQQIVAAYNRVIGSCNSCHTNWQAQYTKN